MTKPHEQTWQIVPEEQRILRLPSPREEGTDIFEYFDGHEAEAKLAACAPEMARILFELMFTRQVALFEDQADRIGDLLKKGGVL